MRIFYLMTESCLIKPEVILLLIPQGNREFTNYRKLPKPSTNMRLRLQKCKALI